MITLIITLIIYIAVFALVIWLLSYSGVPEPFNKALRIIIVVAAIIVLIMLLAGRISPLNI
jgi:hypothetical protein